MSSALPREEGDSALTWQRVGDGVREEVQLAADGEVAALRRAEGHRGEARRAPHARAGQPGAHLAGRAGRAVLQIVSEAVR